MSSKYLAQTFSLYYRQHLGFKGITLPENLQLQRKQGKEAEANKQALRKRVGAKLFLIVLNYILYI